MYYLYEHENQVKIYLSSTKTAYDLKKEGFNIVGQFGRSDYANHWADYKNGKITEKEHRIFLGLTP